MEQTSNAEGAPRRLLAFKPIVFATFLFLPAVLLVGLLLVVFASRDGDRLRKEAIEAVDTKGHLQQVLTLLVDVETGQRGFFATGRPEFLQPYIEGVRDLPPAMAVVRRNLRSAGHPAEMGRLDSLVARKLALASQSIAEKTANPINSDADIARELHGKQQMDATRALISKIESAEAADVARSRERAAAVRGWIATCFGMMFAVLIALIAASLLAARAVLRSRERIAQEALLRSEAAERANRAKSSFLAMMSHELRTPMNGVLGMAHVLGRSELSPDQREKLEVIQTSGAGLMALLNDILDLSKIEAGKMQVESVDFDLGKLLRQQMGLWDEIAAAKDLALELQLESDVARYVSGDPTRVRQIISNLLSNALKFTAAGAVRLCVARAEGCGDRIAFTVADTGSGIAPGAQAKLFQAFEQEDQTTTRRFGGTGLGLAICQRLAVLMQGELSLVRSDASGSSFRLVLPLPRAAAIAEQEVEDAAPMRRLRVLAAEDNAQNQAVIRAFLAAAGAEGEVVDNGAEALDALERSSFDLVLLDVHMPVMDGLEAVAAIRARGLDGGAPVVALTADAMAGDRERHLAAGFDEHLGKPIEPALFMSLLGRVASGQVGRPVVAEPLTAAS